MSNLNQVQYCFRLNLNNPVHLEIHKTLMRANPDVHKSKSALMIECLHEGIEARKQKAKRGKREDVDVTTLELLEQEREHIKEDIKKEIMEDVMRIVLSAMCNKPVGTESLPYDPNDIREKGKPAESDILDADFDPALIEMADLYGA